MRTSINIQTEVVDAAKQLEPLIGPPPGMSPTASDSVTPHWEIAWSDLETTGHDDAPDEWDEKAAALIASLTLKHKAVEKLSDAERKALRLDNHGNHIQEEPET